MEKNLSELDRGIRAVIGAAMFVGMFTWPHTIWGLAGVLPFSTAVLGHCPIYRLLGLNTRRKVG